MAFFVISKLPILLVLFAAVLLAGADELSSSQSKTLLRLQRLLEFPPALSSLNSHSIFCSLPPSPSLSLSCSAGRLTALSIAGDGRALSPGFSVDSLFTTLSRFPLLSSLSLVSLGIHGPLPSKVHRLAALKVLNLSSNSFSGPVPAEISTMTCLENLVLRWNSFNGTVPDLRPLSTLRELDLSGNHFHSSIPVGFQSLDKLQKLDLSSNRFVGSVPSFLFSFPSIQYLDLSNNGLAGALPSSVSCGVELGFVDVSNNLLSGKLPLCLASNSSGRVMLNSGNCFTSGDQRYQHSASYCNQAALAAILPPVAKENGSKSKLGLILGIVGGVIGGAAILGMLLFVVLRIARAKAESFENKALQKPVAGKAVIQVAPRTPADTRRMSQAVRIGTIGLTPHRIFSLEELEEATNNFDPEHLIEEGPQGQFYKGWQSDGSTVLVRCFSLRQKYSPQSLLQYTDAISKLRHRHLVSILGHCIVNGQDNPTTTVFLVLEYVSNGTLRSNLTEWRKREMLKWPQRISVVIGVARGIQFLHTVTVPGIFGNNLTIEKILLDDTLTAKISNYNLPLLLKNKNNKVGSESSLGLEGSDFGSIHNLEQGEKEDVYQLGLILLEVIVGKPAQSRSELDTLTLQLRKSLTDNPAKLKAMADPTIHRTFAYDSLRTAVEVMLNCLSADHKERPSVDDVLWNLQYSAQVQDGWASSENLSSHLQILS